MYANANNQQQYQIAQNGNEKFSFKPTYGQAPTNPLATKFSNVPGLSSGSLTGALRSLRQSVNASKNTAREQSQQPSRPGGVSNLIGNNSNPNTDILIQVKTFHPMTTDQQLCTVFVSKIPELMDDKTVYSLFQIIPGFESFIRLLNGRNEPLSFGFVRFRNVESVKVFTDIFSSIQYSTITDDTFPILFSISTEENTIKYINDKLQEGGRDYFIKYTGRSFKDLRSMASLQIKSWYEVTSATYGDNISIKVQPDHEDDANTKSSDKQDMEFTNLQDVNVDEQEFRDLEIDDKDTVLQEIREFRLLSMKFEKVKQDLDAEEKKERDKYLEKATSKVLANDKSTKDTPQIKSENEYQLFTERDFREMSDSENEITESDETYEELQQGRINQKQERAFEEEQRRWIARERMRTSALEREKARDEGFDIRLEREKKQALKQYGEFIDYGDYEKNTMEYYFNHATWVKNRMRFRQREIANDLLDSEEEEIEVQQKDSEKNEFISSLVSELNSKKTNGSTQMNSTGKFKLSLGGAKKQQVSFGKAHHGNSTNTFPASKVDQATSGNILGEEDEEGSVSDERKKKLLIFNTDYGTLKGIEDFAKLSNNDSSVISLINDIPIAADKLFSHNISWEYITEDIMEDHIKPFVTTLIIEYLGIQEDELIDFVVALLKEHKQAQDLISELEITLDEDAVTFTQRLWRFLIFESERLRQNL